ncbi:hypothetical protein AAVH_38848, partial [Aphelenchoides avenae]
LVVSVGVVVSVEPPPHVYKVMYDAVQADKAPSTPYNLWQTQRVRASELFPRNHGNNSGFVVSLVEDDPAQRIGHPAAVKHTLQSVSSVANRGVILRALGLPDHHFRHTTP